MRAISLVRAWLYGIRGFVVMTASLAIAFSVAITGPPTNSEIGVLTAAVGKAAAAFGDDVEAATIELCPGLPPEVQAMCGGAPAAAEPEAPPSPQDLAPRLEPPAPIELAVNEAPSPQQIRAAESELLGGPPPRVRERAQPPRRATTQRASSSRRAAIERPAASRRATTERRRANTQRATRPSNQRASNQRAQPGPSRERIRAAQQAAQGDLSRAIPRSEPPPVQTAPAVARNDASEEMLSDIPRAMEEYRRMEEAEAAAYRAEQAEREAWEERRRYRREQRRRRYEREYEPPPAEEEYYEEDYPPEEEEYYPTGAW